MDIKELKALGVIPYDIPDASLNQVFQRLNIGNYDPKLKLSQDQISRILYSSELNDHKIKGSLSTAHQGVISKYDELIKGYEQILNGIGNRSNFDSEKKAISDLLTKLKDERNSYQSQVNNFGLNNVEQYFNVNSNKNIIEQGTSEVLKTFAQNTEEKQKDIEKQMEKLYKKLDVVKNSNNKTLSGKIKASFRIKKLESKLNKLRAKQGKLRNTQSKILNTNTNAYVNRMNRNFDRYFKELNEINDIVEEKKFTQDELQESLNEKNEMDLNAINIQAQMVSANSFGRMILNAQNKKNQRNKEKMQKHIQRLQNKMGKVDITKQYNKAFERSYAR